MAAGTVRRPAALSFSGPSAGRACVPVHGCCTLPALSVHCQLRRRQEGRSAKGLLVRAGWSAEIDWQSAKVVESKPAARGVRIAAPHADAAHVWCCFDNLWGVRLPPHASRACSVAFLVLRMRLLRADAGCSAWTHCTARVQGRILIGLHQGTADMYR